MVSVESRMGELAQTFTPVCGYRTGEFDAIWQTRQLTTIRRASPVTAKSKKLSCKTCSGQRCNGHCRF